MKERMPSLSKNLWIERADFMEDAPKKFFRMSPGREVRLKNAYIIMCTGCTKDADGNIVEIQAEYDPNSKSGMEGANRKVKGTLHWVSADHCVKAKLESMIVFLWLRILLPMTGISASYLIPIA